MKGQIIPCLLCVLTINAFSQHTKFRVGGTGGAQISNFIANDNGKARGGWNFGVVATYNLESPFKLSAKLGSTVDRSSFDFPMLPLRQRTWEYVWVDATFVGALLPVVRKSFALVLGSGLSVRRILQAGLRDAPASSQTNGVFGEMYDWSYFLPIQAGVDFNFGGVKRLSVMLEYQMQLRQLYKPGTRTFYYSSMENMTAPKLQSLGMNVAFFCFDMSRMRLNQ